MDRNKSEEVSYSIIVVALRKESVDRNAKAEPNTAKPKAVALRKESVDRNFDIDYYKTRSNASLSARRAWIEIKLQRSIDIISQRRSPQGERG